MMENVSGKMTKIDINKYYKKQIIIESIQSLLKQLVQKTESTQFMYKTQQKNLTGSTQAPPQSQPSLLVHQHTQQSTSANSGVDSPIPPPSLAPPKSSSASFTCL